MIDFNYQDDGTILYQDIDLLMEQLDMLLSTNKCDVLGDENYGQDFEKFLYEMHQSNASIQKYIYDTIDYNIDRRGIPMQVNVDLLPGSERDIILVGITFEYNGSAVTRTFKIE